MNVVKEIKPAAAKAPASAARPGPRPSPAGSKKADGPPKTLQAVELEGWVEKVRKLPDVREDLVRRVKAEIEAGVYDTPEKIRIAAERMLADLL